MKVMDTDWINENPSPNAMPNLVIVIILLRLILGNQDTILRFFNLRIRFRVGARLGLVLDDENIGWGGARGVP